MRYFLTLISYLFHPVMVPIAGTAAYFMVTPKYTPTPVQVASLLPVGILTVVIPIICFLILKNFGLVQTAFLAGRTERAYTLIIVLGLYLMVLLKVLPNTHSPELYYYFVGLVAALGAILFAMIFRVRCSLHMVGMGSLLMFLIALSIHFETNVTLAISLLTLFAGLVASSRLYLGAHGRLRVLIGFFIGFLAQLFTVSYWL